MNIRFDEHGTLCVVEVDGEFVGDSVDPFRRACLDRIDSGVRDLIIDLSMTTLIDSSALETMLDLADAASTRRGRCMLASPDDSIRSVLAVTRLHENLEVHDAVDIAARTIR